MKAASTVRYSRQLNGPPDPKRFDGASAAARKVDVARDPHPPRTGHNREKAWLLWSKIQRGQITDVHSIRAIEKEFAVEFRAFKDKTYSLAGTQVA